MKTNKNENEHRHLITKSYRTIVFDTKITTKFQIARNIWNILKEVNKHLKMYSSLHRRVTWYSYVTSILPKWRGNDLPTISKAIYSQKSSITLYTTSYKQILYYSSQHESYVSHVTVSIFQLISISPNRKRRRRDNHQYLHRLYNITIHHAFRFINAHHVLRTTPSFIHQVGSR